KALHGRQSARCFRNDQIARRALRHPARARRKSGAGNSEVALARPLYAGDLVMASLIGARLPRLEDRVLLTGSARFVADIAADDALHAAFVRSPHAHAAIRAID